MGVDDLIAMSVLYQGESRPEQEPHRSYPVGARYPDAIDWHTFNDFIGWQVGLKPCRDHEYLVASANQSPTESMGELWGPTHYRGIALRKRADL
jgi:hypothetical protein